MTKIAVVVTVHLLNATIIAMKKFPMLKTMKSSNASQKTILQKKKRTMRKPYSQPK